MKTLQTLLIAAALPLAACAESTAKPAASPRQVTQLQPPTTDTRTEDRYIYLPIRGLENSPQHPGGAAPTAEALTRLFYEKAPNTRAKPLSSNTDGRKNIRWCATAPSLPGVALAWHRYRSERSTNASNENEPDFWVAVRFMFTSTPRRETSSEPGAQNKFSLTFAGR